MTSASTTSERLKAIFGMPSAITESIAARLPRGGMSWKRLAKAAIRADKPTAGKPQDSSPTRADDLIDFQHGKTGSYRHPRRIKDNCGQGAHAASSLCSVAAHLFHAPHDRPDGMGCIQRHEALLRRRRN